MKKILLSLFAFVLFNAQIHALISPIYLATQSALSLTQTLLNAEYVLGTNLQGYKNTDLDLSFAGAPVDAELDGEAFVGWDLGIRNQVRLGRKLKFLPGLVLSQRHVFLSVKKELDLRPDLDGYEASFALNSDIEGLYLEIPLLFEYQMNQILYWQFGAYYQKTLDMKGKTKRFIQYAGQDFDPSYEGDTPKDIFKEEDYGLIIGSKLKFSKVSLNLNYYHGLKNAYNGLFDNPVLVPESVPMTASLAPESARISLSISMKLF